MKLPNAIIVFYGVISLLGSAHSQETNPNHLEPIPAYEAHGYDQAVFRALIGESAPDLWMVCKPSFLPEYALILRSEPLEPKKDPFSSVGPRKWTLEHAVATKQIWNFKELEGGRMAFDFRTDVPIDRKQLVIDDFLAQQVQKAWKAVLMLTRYTDSRYRGLDGVTFQFYCPYNYFGEIWSPQTGLPADLVKLATKLDALLESPAQARPQLLKECHAEAVKLEKAAKDAATNSGSMKP